MEVRKFVVADINQIVKLFYETVHSVNKKDYSQEQLEAWASMDDEELRIESWKDSLNKNITYVALINGKIVGFSDMTGDGHLDRLYVHKDFQGQGIATSLVNVLESEARRLGLNELDTEASITAKSFFEHRGYEVVQSQCVERKGIQLINYKMIKVLR
ncbi:GNAT family N-acetyltransferase [Paenibacillus sp. YIM B09110]|uniref:GNAT family N-acetyltransferase n=1 Tax=Paenibacillus sp. YIM B09110 TaxID=3126102 RepID=UPI00301E4A0B